MPESGTCSAPWCHAYVQILAGTLGLCQTSTSLGCRAEGLDLEVIWICRTLIRGCCADVRSDCLEESFADEEEASAHGDEGQGRW